MALSKVAAIETTIHDRLVRIRQENEKGCVADDTTLALYDFVCTTLTFYGSISVGEFNKAIGDLKSVGMLELSKDKVHVRLSEAAWSRYQRQQQAQAQKAQGGQGGAQ